MPRPKPTKEIGIERLAMNASSLLNNPSFKAAVDAVRGAYTQEMINSAPDDASKREHFHRCIHAITDIETALTAFIQSGKIEKSMLMKQEKAKK